MKVSEIIRCIEEAAPSQFQESYDNSRLITGKPGQEINAVLLSLDCTEEVVDEAVKTGCGLIVSHHPLVFSGIKKLRGDNFVERTLIKAIQNNIAIYACHTNLDNVQGGVNFKIAQKLGLENIRILAPKSGLLKKLVTFVPESHLETLRQALFASGAGHIGNYEACSFQSPGTGTFKGNEHSQPFLGKAGELSREAEIRLEVICDTGNEFNVIQALKSTHPYEEPAFDLYTLSNSHPVVGSGIIGYFREAISEREFLSLLKSTFGTKAIRHTAFTGKSVKKVALCGGSGRFLLEKAVDSGAEAYITADFKYHDFFDVDKNLLLADVGHFETEQFTPEIFYELILNKFPKFAIRLSEVKTNPIFYYT